MELSQNLTNLKKFPEPTDFTSNLKTLQEKLPPMLDDFQKYYVFFNKDPEFTEYQIPFENIKKNIQELFTSLFTGSVNLENKTNELTINLEVIAKEIEKEKAINKQLQNTLDKLQGREVSEERINDYENIYNTSYLRNFALLSGIVLSGVVISKVFGS
jgi:hypothetical protein